MILSKVVLPEPDGPRSASSSPSATSRSIFFSASKAPKFLLIPFISIPIVYSLAVFHSTTFFTINVTSASRVSSEATANAPA